MALKLKTVLGQVNNIAFMVNENFDRIKNAVFLKDGSEPMTGDLDMGGYNIINFKNVPIDNTTTNDYTTWSSNKIALELSDIAADAAAVYKGQWSSVITYNKGDIVSDTDNCLYMSLVDSNLNNSTDLQGYWLRLVQYRYEHTQTVPAEIWKITHNLNRADIPILKILVDEGTGIYFVYTVYSGSGNYCGDYSYCGEGYNAEYTKYTEKSFLESRKITDNEIHVVFSAPETGIAEILI